MLEKSGNTYRQRLTLIGIIGAIGAIAGPVWLGISVNEYIETSVEYAANEFITWAAPLPLGAVGGYLATTAGWIMVLIGREHYTTAPPQD